MRFLLLARGRSTGRVRLLSERAFDSRLEAVDAAAVTAATLDLSDDEVLAVDLDGAGPVLVLRVGVPDGAAAADPAPDSGSDAAEVMRVAVAAFAPRPAPSLRPQPRFPLFGAAEEDFFSDEDLADALRRVALRMEADLGGGDGDDTDRFVDDWDARTLDEYALPDDGSLHAAREEGRSLIEAADVFEPEQDNASFGDDPVDADEPIADGWWSSLETEPALADAVSEDTFHMRVAVADPVDVEPAVDDRPDADRVESPTVDWQPPATYYRPANTDFAVWVCGDCVYQRTCRKAGAATPSSCGNFQWRSR